MRQKTRRDKVRELYLPRHSPLHRADARVKLLLAVVFILCLNLAPQRAWAGFILFFAILLAAAILACVGMRAFFLRSLAALPFILAAAPLIFTGPPPLTGLHISTGWQILVSPAGCARLAAIGVKTWLSVQVAVLLAATTRVPDLLTALQQLKMLPIFVSIIRLMWRYLFVIIEEAAHLLRARTSRSASLVSGRSGGSWLWRAHVTGGMAGSLFLRSLERSDRVYAAMLARGYTGSLPGSQSTALSPEDWGVLAAGIALALSLLVLGTWIGA